ncbi:MAG: hypothetical protein OSA39_15380, partial [Sphingobium sp.]|nr:hypothetical protein [Sphingobium sp.]
MTVKALAIWFGVSAMAFAVCCLLMLQFGHAMDAPMLVYPFMAVWGVSALTCPLFLVWLIRKSLQATFHKLG